MSKLGTRVAVVGTFCPTNLKQALLLFDRLAIPALEERLMWLRLFENYYGDDIAGHVANDLEFLQKNNLAFDPGPLIPHLDSIRSKDKAEFYQLLNYGVAMADSNVHHAKRDRYRSLASKEGEISTKEMKAGYKVIGALFRERIAFYQVTLTPIGYSF